MTGSDAAAPRPPADDLVAALGPPLHRTALMLTGDPKAATALVARVLDRALRRGDADAAVGAPGAGAAADQILRSLRTEMVRTYLRHAPRRSDITVTGRSGDPGDVLRSLTPRARAASVLRLVHGWGAPETARAVRVREGRLEALIPGTPALDQAFTSVADAQALPTDLLVRELRAQLPDATAAGGRAAYPRGSGSLLRGRRPALLAAVLVLALLVGYAATRPDQDPTQADGDRQTGVAPGPVRDLTGAGWTLDEDGDPPRAAMGMVRTVDVVVDYSDPQVEVDLGAGVTGSAELAQFAVLWCDMPPTEDANLHPPVGSLAVAGERVEIPCAGTEADPPVGRLVPVPLEGEALLTVAGDLPPRGSARLGVYVETPESSLTPFTEGVPGGVVPPAPPAGAVVLDQRDLAPSPWGGEMRSATVRIGNDSELRLHAGRTGAVAVQLEGIPVTDDGDMGWMLEQPPDEIRPDELVDGVESDPRQDLWSEQQADVRGGRWLVYSPGDQRSFPLPEILRPPPGEQRTVRLSAAAEGLEGHLQVVLTDAERVDVDTRPLARLEAADLPADLPAAVRGFHLLGAWRVPRDGQLRALEGVQTDLEQVDDLVGQQLHSAVLLPDLEQPAREPWEAELSMWSGGAGGFLVGGDVAAPVWDAQPWAHGPDGQLDVTQAVMSVLDPTRSWTMPLAGDWTGSPDGLALTLDPRPGHPDALVLLYEQVPYEEFDFAASPPSPDAWPAAEDPPPGLGRPGGRTVLTLTEEDVVDGRIVTRVEAPDGVGTLLITTRGAGRLRLLSDGLPLETLWASDGWWSSWTAEPVTSQLDLDPSSPSRRSLDLTVEVEGYEEGFTIEVTDLG